MKNIFNNWLHGALTCREALDAREESIRRHLTQVTDEDHCLAAVKEILALQLLQSASVAGSHMSDDVTKLRSCERMECFRMLLVDLEQRHADAKEWVNQQRATKT
jgi:hypothetical protein